MGSGIELSGQRTFEERVRYRHEIDGLRAIAVIPVVLFHAGFSLFAGGYVGVDVFFVISGYLITSIIVDQQRAGQFSIVEFYVRRARRILPALFLVVIVSAPLAYFLMLPDQLKDFSASSVTLMFALSNMFFLSQVGYFSPDAELQPLLHTWSLSVEEQYYLLFPWITIALARFRRRALFWTVAILTVFSFFFAIWATATDADRSFFFSGSRFWEIGVGSLCALISKPKGMAVGNGLSAIGLGMIVGCIFFLPPNTPFPSFSTLIPVIGTALVVVFATKGTVVARLLSAQMFAGLGLISYSTYLWHQPVFAFARLSTPVALGEGAMLFLSVFTIVLGWVTWSLVETPFRRKQGQILPTRRGVLSASFFAACVVVSMGTSAYVSEGLPGRSNGDISFGQIQSRLIPNYGLAEACDGPFLEQAVCASRASPRVLVWGDSFAMHLVPGLLASDPQLSMRQATLSGCAPVAGLAQVGGSKSEDWAQSCLKFNRDVLIWLRHAQSVDLVVLSSPFTEILNFRTMTEAGIVNESGNKSRVRGAILQTVETIRSFGPAVILISPTPQTGENIGQCLVRVVYFGGSARACDFPLNNATNQHDLLRSIEGDVPVYWLDRDICRDSLCNPLQDGRFIYSDFGHLSIEGSTYLGRQHDWAKAFRDQAR